MSSGNLLAYNVRNAIPTVNSDANVGIAYKSFAEWNPDKDIQVDNNMRTFCFILKLSILGRCRFVISGHRQSGTSCKRESIIQKPVLMDCVLRSECKQKKAKHPVPVQDYALDILSLAPFSPTPYALLVAIPISLST